MIWPTGGSGQNEIYVASIFEKEKKSSLSLSVTQTRIKKQKQNKKQLIFKLQNSRQTKKKELIYKN